MTPQGYRFVTISTAPGRRVGIMVCKQGATIEESIKAALDTVALLPGVSEVKS
ncbi:MAG TPA: hypothetical protein VN039_11705 [Nitrospira sp.]|nr:hypothetical protein [Nitrospira sp.]